MALYMGLLRPDPAREYGGKTAQNCYNPPEVPFSGSRPDRICARSLFMGKRTYLRTEDGGQRSEVRRRRAKVGVSASYSRRCRLHLLSSIFHHQSAFTLVELLVVIVIIGVLAALLLPVLTAAKERAIRVACLHNVKQLDLAAIMYARDNNDRLPDSFPTTG